MESTIPVYLCIAYIIVALLALLQHVLREGSRGQRSVEIAGIIVWLTFSILFFGRRGESLGTDTAAYIQHAQGLETARFFDPAFEPGYNLFVYGIVTIFGSAYVLLVIEICYVLLVALACRLWFGNRSLFGLLALISVFSYYNLAFNLIRSGLAIALWLCGLALFLLRKRRGSGIAFYSIAFLLHYSVAIPILVSIVVRYVAGTLLRWFLLVSIIMEFVFGRYSQSILAAAGNIPLLARYVARYVGHEFTYRVGFRSDFLSYCLLYYLILWLAIRLLPNGVTDKRPSKLSTSIARFLFNNYILLFAVFVLAFGLPYSDRSGIFAFLFAPFACLYAWLCVWQQRRTRGLFLWIWLCCCAQFVSTVIYLHRGGVW
jgi:hypothetical protein